PLQSPKARWRPAAAWPWAFEGLVWNWATGRRQCRNGRMPVPCRRKPVHLEQQPEANHVRFGSPVSRAS
ncbi:MAG TPA: hypothetical protein VI136_09005, partial [Verrucomicrobiae bacterium]